MSAYVIVEATVLDAESRNRYASLQPLFREFAAEVIAFGPWQVLSGEPAFDNGMIIRFPDNESALVSIARLSKPPGNPRCRPRLPFPPCQ